MFPKCSPKRQGDDDIPADSGVAASLTTAEPPATSSIDAPGGLADDDFGDFADFSASTNPDTSKTDATNQNTAAASLSSNQR